MLGHGGMDEKGPAMEDCQRSNVRLGSSGEQLGEWDNGFYLTGLVSGADVSFLLDSGSTSSLLSSKLYQSIMKEHNLPLKSVARKIRDVNDNELSVLGRLDLEIQFKENKYPLTVLVCDISQDAILGQDFLLEHVQKIDYRKLQVFIGDEILNCWTGGNAAMVCRVTVKEAVTIPPCSQMTIPVGIPNACRLSKAALIEPSIKLMGKKGVSILPGIIDSKSSCHKANIVNFSTQEIKLFPKTNLGFCKSLLEEPIDCTTHRCARVQLEDPCKKNDNFPEHLQDLLRRSSINLTEEEGVDLNNF